MKVKDFAKALGNFMDCGENDYRVAFNRIFTNTKKQLDYESFVIDSLADIGHSSNVVCFSLEENKEHNGMKVEDLFKVFNDIKNKKSDCFDYGEFEVELKHSYYDGTDAYWGLCVDVYHASEFCVDICSESKEIGFSIDLE